MPSSLTPEQIDALKRQLQHRLEDLRQEVHREMLQSDNERFIDLAGKVHDAEEESVADLLSDVNLAVIDFHINEIRDIEAAQERVGQGEYGVCIDCDGDIEYARLHAYPTAKRCHDCQTKYEHSYVQQGRPKF